MEQEQEIRTVRRKIGAIDAAFTILGLSTHIVCVLMVAGLYGWGWALIAMLTPWIAEAVMLVLLISMGAKAYVFYALVAAYALLAIFAASYFRSARA